MHVARTKTTVKGKVYESVLVRQSYRVGQQVKHRTLASLTRLPAHVIEAVERAIRGETLPASGAGLTILQSWPHGHVAAALGTARQLGLEAVLDPQPSRARDLVLAMVVARVLEPASKLATSQLWDTTSLGRTLGVEKADEDDLYAAMDWLVERQEAIEQRLAERHLQPGGIVLYDLSSTYVEGEHCELAKRGYSRDGKPGQPQIEFGLITNADGDPVAIEAYPGNTADPATFQDQVAKVKDRFGVSDVIWVGDRGMITGAQVAQLQQVSGLSWVTALRAPTIQQLVDAGSVQLSLLDTQNLAEVTDERYPGERLVLCFNPLLAEERAKRREDMLQATERALAKVAAMVERGVAGGRAGLRGAAAIGERLGRVVNKYGMAKHIVRTITDSSFSYGRDPASIAREAQLDGFYVLRTNVSAERLNMAGVVLAYKSLAHIERAFRHFKLSELELRPIYHRRERRVKAHLLLCMLAYWLQRTMERKLAPLLFMDEAPPERPNPVAPAPRSAAARRKEQRKRTEDKLPVQRFRVLLKRLSTVVQNRVLPAGADPSVAFDLLTQPSPLQQRAFDLLGLNLLRK
ncbi:MAG: IS1634 family transposase [Chloroflexota bacterium]|nr:IS1634 family transposase [Chloroflexota bacterium]